MQEPKALIGLVMVVFREAASPPATKSRRKRAAGVADPELVEELQRWKDEVHALRQEMGASAEELRKAFACPPTPRNWHGCRTCGCAPFRA